MAGTPMDLDFSSDYSFAGPSTSSAAVPSTSGASTGQRQFSYNPTGQMAGTGTYTDFSSSAAAASKPQSITQLASAAYCESCDQNFRSEDSYRVHLKSIGHLMKSSGTDLGLDAAKGYVPPIVKPPPVEEKKEKPAEETVHRKQFPDEYFCHICQAKCTSESQFESHNNGARHKKNLVAVEKGIKKAPVARPKSAGDGSKPNVVDTLQPSRCMDKLELMEEPLVGLDYITEFQNEDPDIEEHYMCSLCDSKCDPRTLNTHVIGARHRLAYLKEHHPDMAAMTLQNKKRSEQSVALAEFVKQAVKQDGQKEVKVKLELNPFYNPEQREKEKRKRQEQHRRHAEATAAKRRRLGLTEDDDWGGAYGSGPGRRGRNGPPKGRGRRRYPEDEDDYYYPGGYADYGYPDEPYREGVSRGRGRGRMLPPAALRPRSPRSREAYYEGGYPEAPYEDDPHYGRDPYYHAERRREAYYRREVEGYEADPYGGGRPLPPDFRGPGGRGRGFDDFGRHEQGPSHGPPADRSQLADLIGRAKDLVSSEDDAAMALQLSNALTKALLSYRLKNVPPELLKHAMGELGPNF
ncbi:zinc finger RNA-binding protein-like [Branchiostoma floridae]|uniref:Zinc finger RNA-binding protein-like n=1 Tax=Branchiostoma floridae TaxID=7739 RepID=A0A9J7LTI0_BRAFL|nr:zinc finger RNA-binding protein-like [Branchiostoma floridae]